MQESPCYTHAPQPRNHASYKHFASYAKLPYKANAKFDCLSFHHLTLFTIEISFWDPFSNLRNAKLVPPQTPTSPPRFFPQPLKITRECSKCWVQALTANVICLHKPYRAARLPVIKLCHQAFLMVAFRSRDSYRPMHQGNTSAFSSSVSGEHWYRGDICFIELGGQVHSSCLIAGSSLPLEWGWGQWYSPWKPRNTLHKCSTCSKLNTFTAHQQQSCF